MSRIAADMPQEHGMRQTNGLGMMGRNPEGHKTPQDPFMTSQPGENHKQSQGEGSRQEDYPLNDKKINMSAEKAGKPMFPPGPSGPGMPLLGSMKRMGGPDEKVDVESLKDLDFVNPLLYKPASKPPVIKEGDWLCPDATCCNVNWAKRIYCNRCGIQRPNLNKIKNKTYMLAKLYEENTWSCGNCKNINKGERKRCNHCNDYKPNDIDEELRNAKPEDGHPDHMDMHGDMPDDYGMESRYGRPQGSKGKNDRGKGSFGGGRGGSKGPNKGGNRGPPGRGPPMKRGGYGGRYGPPGFYEGGMGGPDGPYMGDFGRNGPSRGMMRGGRNNFGPSGPQNRGPPRGNYMEDPFDEENGGHSSNRQGGQYQENFRERSRSQEKNQEGSGGMN